MQQTLARGRRSIRDGQSVSIIVPCFNESEGIEDLSKQLLPVVARLGLARSTELILVDDGSSDDTFLQFQQHFQSSARMIRHAKNQGLSAAIQTGLEHSTGAIVCTMDSDCTYAPEQLIPLLELMDEDVDIVTASPYHPSGCVGDVPGWRLFLSKGLSQIYRVVLPRKLYTYTSMFRAYRREVLEEIPVTQPGFLGLVEVLAEAILQGYRVVEYPAKIQTRRYGQSKLRVAKVIWQHLQYVGKLVIRRSRNSRKTRSLRYKYAQND